MSTDGNQRRLHAISVVIPVYSGEATLDDLVAELMPLCEPTTTERGATMYVSEIILVHDCGPDRSDRTIRRLCAEFDEVRAVWLSRNFGQHAATLAGMASSSGDWICSIDEDGQHDPAFIPAMLDCALAERATVVYADPSNRPDHGVFRNGTSRLAKWLFVHVLSSDRQPGYHSFRLVLGEIGRNLAAYSGRGIYLDVALAWTTEQFASCPVELRSDAERRSGYSMRRLVAHFWRLVLTSGTRPMRIMSLTGAIFAVVGVLAAAWAVVGRLTGRIVVEGWASLAVVSTVGFGLVLISIGIVAEYVGVAARMAMGQPPYLIVADELEGPLGDLHPANQSDRPGRDRPLDDEPA